LVLWSHDWHPGVVGLAASRILEKYARPAIVISLSQGSGKGSGRSRRPFHLVQALEGCAGLLTKFGGHEFAAGLSIEESKLQEFRERMHASAMSQIPESEMIPEIDLDSLCEFIEINPQLMREMEQLQPFGLKNPRPLFAAKGCSLMPGTRPVGADASHLKLELRQGPATFSGIAFRQAALLESLDIRRPVDIAFSPSWNEFNGKRSLQLEVKDMVQAE
jgi:single-stranded-DNA-specific exonuclease